MKLRNLLLLAGAALMLSACDDSKYDIDNLVPEQYHKILYVNNSGKQELTLYNTGENTTYTMSVFKSGSDPSLTASVDIRLLTEEELNTEYVEPEAVNYKILDSGCYELETTHLDFASEDRYKTVNITLVPGVIEQAMLAQPDVVWVLPLIVVSDKDSINSEKNEMFLQISSVVTPSFGFASTDVTIVNCAYQSDMTQNITLGLDTENNWDIDFTLAVDENYLNDYNAGHGTSYQLPRGAYTMETELSLPSGTTQLDVPVTISAGELSPGDYMLPIRITNTSLFEISGSADVYPLVFRVLGKELDRSGWSIEANTQENNGEGTGNGVPSCAIDGNLNTYWHSSWQSGTHSLPHELIVDTQGSYTFTQFAMMQRQSESYTDTAAGKFYVSDDKTNWIEVGSFTMEKIFDLQYFTVQNPVKGRYFKVEITESYRGLNTSLTEIYAYGL